MLSSVSPLSQKDEVVNLLSVGVVQLLADAFAIKPSLLNPDYIV